MTENNQGVYPGNTDSDEKFEMTIDGENAAYWLSALIDSAEDAIISKTLDGIITSWNKGAERIFGYTAPEVIGKPIFILIPPDHHNEEREILDRIKKGEHVSHYETVRRRKDGSLVDISLTVSPIKRPDGKIIGASKIARDISKAKQAEATLRENEKQLRMITDAVPALISYVDSEHRYQFVNRHYSGWFEIPQEKFVGTHLPEIIGEKAYQAVMPKIERVLSGEKLSFEQTMTYPNRERIIHVDYIPDFDEENSNVRGFYALVQDISESKKAEQNLRESEERYRMLFESIDQGFCLCEVIFDENEKPVDYRFLEVNPVFEKMTGIPNEAARSEKTARELVQNLEDKWVEMYGNIALTGEPVRFVEGSDAMNRWFDVYAFRVGEKHLRRVAIFFNDITERKQAEEKLIKSDARLRLALDISQTSTFEINFLTDEVETDDTGRAIYGWEKDEQLTFTQVQRHFHPEDRDEVMLRVKEALNPDGAGEFEIEQRIIRTDGDTRWIRVRGRVFFEGEDESRRAVRCLGTYIDITERKNAERQLEELLRREQSARREAESANRLKDEFLATVSHELRTPLNAILGWSQVLTSGRHPESDVARAVQTIYRNAKSQAQLIEDILDVSRIITGKIRLEPRPVLIAPVIQTAVETLRPTIEAKNIRLQLILGFEHKMSFADPDRLQQVVWNLLSNAIKFTPDHGQIKLELESGESSTKIVVSDTGKGISPEFLPHVFERFRQADGSSTRTHGGLGLGLAIVRHIVELHGGTVEVQSEGEGKGTIFTVRLPLLEKAVNLSKENNGNDSKAQMQNINEQLSNFQSKIKNMRVLLLDDEADTLELLSAVLAQSGAEVKTEKTVREALQTLEKWRPDVIISDIAMPDEDGYSFIKKLRRLPAENGGKIPVIALTAYVGIKERTNVLSSGFQMYVPKPVEPFELLAAVANFARQ
jgi:PAS domain S-box-containing protein